MKEELRKRLMILKGRADAMKKFYSDILTFKDPANIAAGYKTYEHGMKDLLVDIELFKLEIAIDTADLY